MCIRDRYKTISFVGDTGGTWRTDGTQGLYVALASAGSGDSAVTTAGTWQGGGYKNRTSSSANLFATNGATIQFTGLQLEAGTQATVFEYRSVGEELRLCQRYYQKYIGPRLRGVIGAGSQSINRMGMTLLVELRANPTAAFSGNQSLYDGSGTATMTALSASYVDHASFEADVTISGNLNSGSGGCVCSYLDGNEATLSLDAEI